MNFGMLRGVGFIGSMLLVVALLCLVACGGDSGTSANDDLSSNSVALSPSTSSGQAPLSVASNGSKASSSSKKVSSSSRVNSVGSSSVGKSSSSSSAKNASSSSSGLLELPCEHENIISTFRDELYICHDGFLVPYVASSSSQKVLTFKERFKKDSVFNDEIEYGAFKDPRDGQEYKTVVIKSKYEQFEIFAQNLNYGTQIKLETTEFDDNKVEKYCYDDDPWYCENYFGGMYSWSEAMGLPRLVIPSGRELRQNAQIL